MSNSTLYSILICDDLFMGDVGYIVTNPNYNTTYAASYTKANG